MRAVSGEAVSLAGVERRALTFRSSSDVRSTCCSRLRMLRSHAHDRSLVLCFYVFIYGISSKRETSGNLESSHLSSLPVALVRTTNLVRNDNKLLYSQEDGVKKNGFVKRRKVILNIVQNSEPLTSNLVIFVQRNAP